MLTHNYVITTSVIFKNFILMALFYDIIIILFTLHFGIYTLKNIEINFIAEMNCMLTMSLTQPYLN